MAASEAVARRYAEALFAAARSGDQIDAVEQDLALLADLTRQSPRVLEMLRNPILPSDRKREIVQRLVGGSVQPVTLRLLDLLIEKRRSEVLPHLEPLFIDMANEYRGVLPATVASAMPLTPEEERTLAARLSAMTGKQVVLQTQVEPELIGGMCVHVGDTVIDGTVVGYLRQLRAQLKEALF